MVLVARGLLDMVVTCQRIGFVLLVANAAWSSCCGSGTSYLISSVKDTPGGCASIAQGVVSVR